MSEQIALLILEHLRKANGNPLPEGTLFVGIRYMTTPIAKRSQFDRVVYVPRPRKARRRRLIRRQLHAEVAMPPATRP